MSSLCSCILYDCDGGGDNADDDDNGDCDGDDNDDDDDDDFKGSIDDDDDDDSLQSCRSLIGWNLIVMSSPLIHHRLECDNDDIPLAATY